MARRTTIKNAEAVVKLERSAIEPLFDKFMKAKKVSNVSNYTLIYYQNGYNFFIKRNGIKFVEEITEDRVIDIIANDMDEGIKNARTYNTKLTAFRSFVIYLQERGLVQYFKIKKLKEQESPKDTYTEEELKALIQKPVSTKWVEWRNWALVNYLIGTGNRCNSILNIKIGDIDFEKNFVNVRVTKNGKAFCCPITLALKDVLIEYLNTFDWTEDDYLFQSNEGGQLTRYGLRDAVKSWNHKHGVEKTGIHLFRHTYAKKVLQNGGTVAQLQAYLQHSNPEMSLHYAKLYKLEDIAYNYEAINPLNNLIQ